MISLTLPGTAMSYNGEEIAMDDTFIPWSRVQDPISINNREHYAEVGRDPERTPMQWDDTTSAGTSQLSLHFTPLAYPGERLRKKAIRGGLPISPMITFDENFN